jgi:hypothetical protein
VDEDAELPNPRLTRQQAQELFQTAQAILRTAGRPGTQRLAQTLVEQIVEMVPELKDARPSSAKNRRKQRTQREVFAPRPLSDKFFIKPIEER